MMPMVSHRHAFFARNPALVAPRTALRIRASRAASSIRAAYKVTFINKETHDELVGEAGKVWSSWLSP